MPRKGSDFTGLNGASSSAADREDRTPSYRQSRALIQFPCEINALDDGVVVTLPDYFL